MPPDLRKQGPVRSAVKLAMGWRGGAARRTAPVLTSGSWPARSGGNYFVHFVVSVLFVVKSESKRMTAVAFHNTEHYPCHGDGKPDYGIRPLIT
jgi:hypothetical protein